MHDDFKSRIEGLGADAYSIGTHCGVTKDDLELLFRAGIVKAALTESLGVQNHAAKKLGMVRTTLITQIEALGLALWVTELRSRYVYRRRRKNGINGFTFEILEKTRKNV